jgi:hypothetical protein
MASPGGGVGFDLLTGACNVTLLSPFYDGTNVTLTLSNADLSTSYDIYTTTNLGLYDWTVAAEGTNGQTVFFITNVPVDESYYTAACTNDTDGAA